MTDATIPAPPELKTLSIDDRRRDRHAHPRAARRAQRDEPGDDLRAHRRRRLARRPGAAARPVVTGAGRARLQRRRRRELVSSGGLDDPEVDLPANVRRGAEVLHQAIVDFRRIPYPVIGAINGVAAGAGFSLALMCDFRIASTNAAFVCAYGRIGASPDGGMTYFLPRVVGPDKALQLLLDDPLLSRRAGAGARDRLEGRRRRTSCSTTARAKAAKLAAKAPHYVRMAKLLIGQSLDNSLTEHLQVERHGIADSMATEDLREGARRVLRRPRGDASPGAEASPEARRQPRTKGTADEEASAITLTALALAPAALGLAACGGGDDSSSTTRRPRPRRRRRPVAAAPDGRSRSSRPTRAASSPSPRPRSPPRRATTRSTSTTRRRSTHDVVIEDAGRQPGRRDRSDLAAARPRPPADLAARHLHVLLLGRLPPRGRHGGHAHRQVTDGAVTRRSARPTDSATQTGFSPPSRSSVNLVATWTQPSPSSSTETISAVARTFEPAGTGPGSGPCSSRS